MRNAVFDITNNPQNMRDIPLAIRLLKVQPTNQLIKVHNAKGFKESHENIYKVFERIFFKRHRLWDKFLSLDNDT